MLSVEKITDLMRAIAPEEYEFKQAFDNIGLLLGDSSCKTDSVMCCLDLTEAVANEAIERGCGLIITHHPFVYSKLFLTNKTPMGALLLKLAAKNIAVYSAHTNLDFVAGGINEFNAELLGLSDCVPLLPYISESEGAGRIGTLKTALTAEQLRKLCAKAFDDEYVRVVADDGRLIKKVAVINGGGGGDFAFIDCAINAGADCLVTADVKHHIAIYALMNKLVIVEPQHFCMEYPFIKRLVAVLAQKVAENGLKLNIYCAQSEINPRK